jgi:hypothetical protein
MVLTFWNDLVWKEESEKRLHQSERHGDRVDRLACAEAYLIARNMNMFGSSSM